MGNNHNLRVITSNYYYSTSTTPIGPLVIMLIACNTSEYFPSPLYCLQQTAFTLSHCLPPIVLIYSLHATTCWCFPFPCFLPPSIGCYLPMAANNLPFQKLLSGRPFVSLFYMKCKPMKQTIT